ncbi:MAG: histidinol phosphatase, partial [Planctomycetota bacterium]
GIAANDCHHNHIITVKKVDETSALVGTNVDDDDEMRRVTTELAPGLASLLKGKKAGEKVVELDFDPYDRAMRNVSTHVFAKELSESSVRDAVRRGHAYVCHDWICDPSGFFAFVERKGKPVALIGDEISYEPGDQLRFLLPVPAEVQLFRSGQFVRRKRGRDLQFPVLAAGVYRAEVTLRVDGEDRQWIYTNPFYLRAPRG